jgi:hypothetical protein
MYIATRYPDVVKFLKLDDDDVYIVSSILDERDRDIEVMRGMLFKEGIANNRNFSDLVQRINMEAEARILASPVGVRGCELFSVIQSTNSWSVICYQILPALEAEGLRIDVAQKIVLAKCMTKNSGHELATSLRSSGVFTELQCALIEKVIK